jgi:hypothetical protein
MKYCLLHVISGTYVSNRIYTFDAAGGILPGPVDGPLAGMGRCVIK